MTACSLLLQKPSATALGYRAGSRQGVTRGVRLLAILVIFSIAGSVPAIYAENGAITEYHIKAAFLYNFAKFVEWPSMAFESGTPAFTLCVMGVEPYINIRESLTGKTIKGRRVVVKRAEGAATAGGCQILFVSAQETPLVRNDLPILSGHALTVGETDDFIHLGGLINLKTVNNRVRFEIDRRSGEQFGFRFSAQLLKLAILVHREG